MAAAALASERGHWVAGADVAARIRWAAGLVSERSAPGVTYPFVGASLDSGPSAAEAAEVIYSLVGTSLATQESVPAAFAVLSAVPEDPWEACLLAASLGGDTDTIAAMAGAIGGAVHGLSAFPPHAVEIIDAQGLGLADLADSLLAAARREYPERRQVARDRPAPSRCSRARPSSTWSCGSPRCPRAAANCLATSAEITAGGGFNVMAAAARQGLPVLYAGGHGTGPWGDVVRAALAAEGIGLLRPPDPDRDTGFDVALVEPDAERTFVTHLGAEAVRGPQAWTAVRAQPGDAVYVSGYGLVPPESGPALGAWAASLPSGVLLFVDPGPLVAQIPAAVLDPVLARCDWLSCNHREASLLAGAGLARRPSVGDPRGAQAGPAATVAARRLLARGTAANIMVRAGAAGCYIAPLASADAIHVRAPQVTAVDTTGAGDAHSGAFLAALADGLPPLGAAARANAAAAFAVTRPGPATVADPGPAGRLARRLTGGPSARARYDPGCRRRRFHFVTRPASLGTGPLDGKRKGDQSCSS